MNTHITLTEAEKRDIQIEIAALRAGRVHMRDVFAMFERSLAERMAQAWDEGCDAAALALVGEGKPYLGPRNPYREGGAA
jgi:hypothetical protein